MDYKKKYDEALNDMRAIYPNLKGDAKLAVEHAFPELRESEDERIRKAIIHYILYETKGNISEDTEHVWVAWLEKQKEQKPVEKEITLTSFEEALNAFLFDFAHSPIEDCEPKEYIKKYSAEILKAAYKELNAKLQQDIFEAKQEGRREGYEVAKAEQKPAEWTEEDKKIIDTIISVLGQYIDYKAVSGTGSGYATPRYAKEIDWLKSIRPSWKPSEEQMEYLQEAIKEAKRKHDISIIGYYGYIVLVSLREDLKKL